MKLLLGIEGGIGKHIAATGMIRLAHEQGYEVDVVCAHPLALQGNPNINRVYEWQRGEYFIEKFGDYDQVILDDPYRQRPFLSGQLTLAQTFCWMFDGGLSEEEDCRPDYYITLAEEQEIVGFIKDFKKPILCVQTNGGQHQGWAWTKDMPLTEAAQVLQQFTEDYEIIHFRQQGQPQIEGIRHTEELNFRQCIALMSRSEKRFLIDSYLQHAAAALELPSTVYWAATTPQQFGYQIHDNIPSYEAQLKNTDRLELLFPGLDHTSFKCPYAQGQRMIQIEETVKSLRDK